MSEEMGSFGCSEESSPFGLGGRGKAEKAALTK